MIGFSIMMWFVSFILFIVSISLLRGNSSSMHGKVYEMTDDKEGYAKASGKVTLFMAFGVAVCGAVALIDVSNNNLCYSIVVLLIVIIISAYFFIRTQKNFGTTNDKTSDSNNTVNDEKNNL